ncbi:MAG TPA: hypothetical protein VGB30_02665 [bacterium]|jgi:hypothetical protein
MVFVIYAVTKIVLGIPEEEFSGIGDGLQRMVRYVLIGGTASMLAPFLFLKMKLADGEEA